MHATAFCQSCYKDFLYKVLIYVHQIFLSLISQSQQNQEFHFRHLQLLNDYNDQLSAQKGHKLFRKPTHMLARDQTPWKHKFALLIRGEKRVRNWYRTTWNWFCFSIFFSGWAQHPRDKNNPSVREGKVFTVFQPQLGICKTYVRISGDQCYRPNLFRIPFFRNKKRI